MEPTIDRLANSLREARNKIDEALRLVDELRGSQPQEEKITDKIPREILSGAGM